MQISIHSDALRLGAQEVALRVNKSIADSLSSRLLLSILQFGMMDSSLRWNDNVGGIST
ncbi:MAG: hypothetical protein JKY10_08490 [Cohaesibacteraceae bacterium]|nr:hypothetical protein [Cohaesibacteraceae bacterium]